MFPFPPPDDESFPNPQATLPPPMQTPVSLPQQAPAWAALLPALFSIGARIGGNKEIGPAAIGGYQQGVQQVDVQRQQALREQLAVQEEGRRQEDSRLRHEYLLQQQQQQIEQRRQQQIGAVVDNLRAQKFPTKAAYDAAVTGYETQLGMRPNTLRTAVPYTGPTAEADAKKAIETLVQTHGAEVLGSGGFVEFDRDGDGIAERVPIAEAAELGRYPVIRDAQGGIIQPPKDVKINNPSEFETRLQSAVDVFTAEKGRPPDAKERDAIITKVARDPADPTLQAIREIALAQARAGANTPALPPRLQSQVNALAARYSNDKNVQRAVTQAEGVNFAQSMDPNSKNPGDDLALIYAFAKAMDPESVVREGEYKTAERYAGTFLSQFGFNFRRIYENTEFLTPTAKAMLKKTMMSKFEASRQTYDNLRKGYVKQFRAMTQGTNAEPDDYLIDYAGAFPASAAGPSAPPPPAASVPPDVRARAKQILLDGKYDASDASIDKFLQNPKNRALLGIKEPK